MSSMIKYCFIVCRFTCKKQRGGLQPKTVVPSSTCLVSGCAHGPCLERTQEVPLESNEHSMPPLKHESMPFSYTHSRLSSGLCWSVIPFSFAKGQYSHIREYVWRVSHASDPSLRWGAGGFLALVPRLRLPLCACRDEVESHTRKTMVLVCSERVR